jgi:hypothetical protein
MIAVSVSLIVVVIVVSMIVFLVVSMVVVVVSMIAYAPQESTSTSKPHISKAVTGQSEFDEIKGMIQQLGTRMDSFESKRPEQQSYRPTHQPHQSWKPTQPQPRSTLVERNSLSDVKQLSIHQSP